MVVPGGRGRLGGIQVLERSPELGGIQVLPHLGAGRCSQPRGCSGVPAGSGGATFIPAGLSRLTLCRGVRVGSSLFHGVCGAVCALPVFGFLKYLGVAFTDLSLFLSPPFPRLVVLNSIT